MSNENAENRSPEDLAVRFAHAVLKQLPGAAFDGEPFMLPTIGKWKGKPYVACCCYYHSVAFLDDKALVFSREEGGMVPWAGTDENFLPNPDYFECAFTLPEDTSTLLLKHVQAQAAKAAIAENGHQTLPKP